jgi:putative ATP-dependent endonuclease of OLD family
MNNTGKTSFLKALQIALGNRQFISQDDFFIKNNDCATNITIDVLIVPVDAKGKQEDRFSDDWEALLTTDRIRIDGTESFLPLRTNVTFDAIKNSYKVEQTILQVFIPVSTVVCSSSTSIFSRPRNPEIRIVFIRMFILYFGEASASVA